MTEPAVDEYASDDERLSALIDGELSPAATRALKTRLAQEPALARRLQAMRNADRRIRAAYGPLAEEPLPPALRALIRAEISSAEPAGGTGHAAAVMAYGAPPMRSSWVPTSLAAGIVLAVGITLGLALNWRGGEPSLEDLIAGDSLIMPGDPLFDIFEAVPSGDSEELTAAITAAPRLSFRTGTGEYCRELALSSSEGQAALIACRESSGWQIEAGAHEVAMPSGEDAFAPASRSGSSLDAVAEQLMEGPPLGLPEERAAIVAGWR